MYKFRYAAITHQGNVRAKNEDNFYIDGKWKRDEDENYCQTVGSAENRLLAAVCDGMGGRAKGERASFLAVETMEEYEQYIKEKKVPEFQKDPMTYVNEANIRICKEIKKQGTAMGSTLSVLEFVSDFVTAGNLGDSRIYQMRDNILSQLSKDHTVVARMVRMGQITPEEADTHPMRHRITQHLGIEPEDMILEPAMAGPIKIKTNDKYLICSDGLTDMVGDYEIAEILNEETALKGVAENLVQHALAAGGKDNVTVILIEVREKDSGIEEKVSGGNIIKNIAEKLFGKE